MNTPTQLTHHNSPAITSLAGPMGRHLRLLLGTMRRSLQAGSAPAASTISTSALDKGRTLWVNQPMTRDINCLEGTLWLTFDGVRKDIILEAGQSYRCDCDSRLAIHALDAARFDMT
jgi:hypothetical protein